MTGREWLAGLVALVSLLGSLLYAGRAVGRMEAQVEILTAMVQELRADVNQARETSHAMELWVRDAFLAQMKEGR